MLKRVILVQCKTPGDVLRKLRTDRGLTQKAVAEEMLSNPEKTEQAAPKKRVPKKVSAEPAAIGQLRPEEKSLIAIFRRCDPASRQEIYRAAKEKVHL